MNLLKDVRKIKLNQILLLKKFQRIIVAQYAKLKKQVLFRSNKKSRRKNYPAALNVPKGI